MKRLSTLPLSLWPILLGALLEPIGGFGRIPVARTIARFNGSVAGATPLSKDLVMERAVINTDGTVLRIVDHFEKPNVEDRTQSDKTLEEMEKEYIIRILHNTGWRIDERKGAAKILGLNPSTLRSRMAKLGIQKLDGKMASVV